MIALDSNILVRLLTHDDPVQLAAIARFLEKRSGETFLIPDVVCVETVWTLSRLYRWHNDAIVGALRSLSERSDVEFENRERFMSAIKALESGADFADRLIIETARKLGCAGFATLDENLARSHPDFVVRPK